MDEASTDKLVAQWLEMKWLHINDVSGYYELGARSHLELRPLLEAAITCHAEDQDEDEEQGSARAGGGGLLQQALPQIIYY